MRKFIKGTFPDMDVDQENIELDAWKRPITKESPQTIRNMSRIEQLEAGQAEIKKTLSQFVTDYVTYLMSSPWESRISHSWQRLAGTYEESLRQWIQAAASRKPLVSTFEQLKLKLSKIAKLFGEFEEDFDDISLRLTRCAVLEEELASFEDSLEDEEEEHLASCVSLIRDALDYNYAEDLTQTHLDLLKKAIGLICEKALECSKEDYQKLHQEFLQSRLALLPTTRKAIEKYESSKPNDGR